MPAPHVLYFKKKYGWNGKKPSELIGKIIAHNTEKTAKMIASHSKGQLEKGFVKMRSTSKLAMPLPENVVRRSGILNKSQHNGQLITKTMQTRLRKSISDALADHADILTQPGGQKKAIAAAKQNLQAVFDSYRNPEKGATNSQINTIATTEIQSSTSAIRHEYAKAADAAAKEAGYELRKIWIHNPSDMPRKYHIRMDGKTAGIDEPFTLKTDKGVFVIQRPHDPMLPAGQVINCRCELKYEWRKV